MKDATPVRCCPDGEIVGWVQPVRRSWAGQFGSVSTTVYVAHLARPAGLERIEGEYVSLESADQAVRLASRGRA